MAIDYCRCSRRADEINAFRDFQRNVYGSKMAPMAAIFGSVLVDGAVLQWMNSKHRKPEMRPRYCSQLIQILIKALLATDGNYFNGTLH